MISTENITFGFPTNYTLKDDFSNIENIKKMDLSNKNLKLELTLEKGLKKSFNQIELANEIKETTNASSVKILYVYKQETNIRSREVSEQRDISEKFKSYAALNEIKYKDSCIDKIKDIQSSMILESFIPHDTFTLEYASIRGAIGLMDQGHREELNVDFTNQFDEGIIAITGKIGSGKTTFLENLSPYPSMLTRTGTLKDHFCLKDSHRILIYRTSTGKRIKIKMLIDGAAKNQMNTFIVEEQGEDGVWVPNRNIDGHTDSYTKWVESTFGSKSLFLRTSFYTNGTIKNIPDLSQAGKTEKMELFSILSGTDYLSEFSDKAKLAIKEEEKIIDDIKSQLKDFDNIEKKIDDNKVLLTENNSKIEQYTTLIEQDEKDLLLYEKKQNEFIKASASYDIYRIQLNEKTEEKDSLERELYSVQSNIEGYEQQLAEVDTYKEQLEWYDNAMEKRKLLVKEESELRDQFYALQASLSTKEEEYNKHEKNYSNSETSLKIAKLNIQNLTKSIPDLDGTCPVCGAPITEHKKEELQKEIEGIKSEISKLTKQSQYDESVIETESKWLKNNPITSYKTEVTNLNKKLIEVSNDISQIDSYAAEIDTESIKDILNNASSQLETEKSKESSLIKKIDALDNEINIYADKLANIPEDHSDKIARLKRGIDDSKEQIAMIKAENVMAEKELNRLSGFEDEVKSIKEQIKNHQQNIKDYEIIQKAFSNNGIQALELDSAAPEISDIANAILSETYGDRFSISFDTQRETKDKRKIDDFIINVFDSESGRVKRLDYISSGEGALIKQTLYYAFSVIRMRRTGFCFKTRFLDESDGSLDSETRVKYLKMIESAHKQCGAVQTILITHSQELKDLISQKIEL